MGAAPVSCPAGWHGRRRPGASQGVRGADTGSAPGQSEGDDGCRSTGELPGIRGEPVVRAAEDGRPAQRRRPARGRGPAAERADQGGGPLAPHRGARGVRPADPLPAAGQPLAAEVAAARAERRRAAGHRHRPGRLGCRRVAPGDARRPGPADRTAAHRAGAAPPSSRLRSSRGYPQLRGPARGGGGPDPGLLRRQQLLAWADAKSLVAWDIGADGNEYRQRLVPVDAGGGRAVPLSGLRSPKDNTEGRWQPVFAER